MWRIRTMLSAVLSLAILGCSLDEKDAPTAPGDTSGTLSLRLSIDPASPFKSIARSGTLTVSGADMSPLSSPLTLGDSTVAAEIAGIPAGKNRLIELKVFAEDGTLGYQGSGLADIFPDSTTRVAINLVRTTGTAVVFGRIIEDTAATAWPAPTLVTLGAQASVHFGAALDIDLAQALTSAQANADQGAIDLVFLYYGAAFHLDNAVTAKAAGITHSINLTNNFDSAKLRDVLMVKVASRPADPESAKRTFAAGAKIRGSVIAAGDLFLVESTEGRLALVTVANIVGTGSMGTLEVRLERSALP